GVDPDLYSARSTAALNRTGDASRVRRGGCWSDEGWPCRSACRLRFEPERRYDHIGFRVAGVQPERIEAPLRELPLPAGVARASGRSVFVSSTSRTLRASAVAVNGFCRKCVASRSTP